MASAPVTLSTGRVALHRLLQNGAQEVYFQDESEMTNAEWAEYCDIVRRATEAEGGTFVS